MEGFRLVSKTLFLSSKPLISPLEKDPAPVLKGEVEENMTFYYSNFKLFSEYSEILFSKYIAFKKDLQAFLGIKCPYLSLNRPRWRMV